jgi:signal transduction histidine kinase
MVAMFLAMALTFVVAGALFASALQRNAARDMDTRLRSIALDLLAGLSFEPDGTAVLNRIPDRIEFDDRFSGWYWQIKLVDEIIARSRSLLLDELTAPQPNQTHVGPGGFVLRTAIVDREFANPSRLVTIQVSAPQSEVDEGVVNELKLLGFGLTLLLLALIGVTGWLLSRGMAPLRTIQKDLGDMISGVSDRLHVTGYRELDGMVGLINSLVEQGRQQVATHRDAASKLAHALKTPLALIAARTDLSGATPDPDIQSSVAAMRSQIEHNLSRTRLAGGRSGLSVRVPIEPVVRDLMFAFAHAYQDRGITQSIGIAREATFLGDKDDLLELLGNLLDNAHRFARTRVSVTAQNAGNELIVTIRDDGPGLHAPGPQPADAGIASSTKHQGLGLVIAQEIVDAYDGALSFAPDDPAGGLAVSLRLPATASVRT